MVTGTHTRSVAFGVEIHEEPPVAEEQFAQEAYEQEWSTEGIDPQMWGGQLPGPPVPKDVLAAWAIRDQINFPESRPVEDAMRALVIGHEADAEPVDFLDSAIALVATLG